MVVVFGAAVTDNEAFSSIALPSIRKLSEPNSVIATRHGYDSIQQPYNELLDEAAAHADLEALVLLHQDLELLDGSLLDRVRPLLAEPRVGVVGVLGAAGGPLHYWTDAERLFGRMRTPTVDYRYSTGAHEVEIVDGHLLVLAPWVVRTLRFDESLADDFHGYDVDFCMRVRAAGGRVACTDAPYCHHMARPWTDRDAVRRSGRRLAERWDPALRPPEWAPAFRR